jgi:small subunit ribosomal protein S6
LRDYEILYIVRPELDEEQLNVAVERVNSLIGNLGGTSQKTDIWGKRRLAYEVGRLREGYYVLTDFQIEPERVPEMESTLKISDTVFRHLIVRKPEKTAANGPAAPPAEVEADPSGEAAGAEEPAGAEPEEEGPEAVQPEASDAVEPEPAEAVEPEEADAADGEEEVQE